MNRYVEPGSLAVQRPRQTHEFTILAQDPDLMDTDGRPLTTTVRVPFEFFEPGPRSHRFHVVDYDASTHRLRVPPALNVNLGPPADLKSLAADQGFHAQNAFVIAARTLAAFESALGRRIEWGFDGHQLYIVPHALAEANAFYSDDDRALFFGYFDTDAGTVFTCLSHDIVAHETTHAVLDGLRPRYDSAPGLPDQGAFHEAFADIVALLSAFALPDLAKHLIGRADPDGLIAAGDVSEERLAATFGTMAEQLGRSLYGRSAVGLRNSLELARRFATDPGGWRRDPSFEEVHNRGEVLVAAVMKSVIRIWRARLQDLIIDRKLNPDRAAEEGAKVAEHVLKMSIRALDYCPPAEFEFEDFLDALLVADAEVEPDDKHKYRPALESSFAELDIRRPEQRIIDLAQPVDGVLVPPFTYDGFNYIQLRSDPNEVYRFMWENRAALGINLSFYTHVEHVRQVTRLGSDGFMLTDVIADYVQELDGTKDELEQALGFKLPASVPADRDLKLWGGGVLICDQFGRAKFHQFKPLNDATRQARRLEYLVNRGRSDTSGRYGFSAGVPHGQRYAELHRTVVSPGEAW